MYKLKTDAELTELRRRLRKLEEFLQKQSGYKLEVEKTVAHKPKTPPKGNQPKLAWKPKDQSKSELKQQQPNQQQSSIAEQEVKQKQARVPKPYSPPQRESFRNKKQIFIKGIVDSDLVNANSEWITQYFAETEIFEGTWIEEVDAFQTRNKIGIVKVTLGSEEDVNLVLRRKHKLAWCPGFDRVYIERQKSREERDAMYKERHARKQHAQAQSTTRPVPRNSLVTQPRHVPAQSPLPPTRPRHVTVGSPLLTHPRPLSQQRTPVQFPHHATVPRSPQHHAQVHYSHDPYSQAVDQAEMQNQPSFDQSFQYHQNDMSTEQSIPSSDLNHLNEHLYLRNQPPIPQRQILMRAPAPRGMPNYGF